MGCNEIYIFMKADRFDDRYIILTMRKNVYVESVSIRGSYLT